MRTFAYTSGPAYGLLLDVSSPGWTRRVRSTDDLATLVMRALAVQPATGATASAARYGGAEIHASEQQREQRGQERVAELRRRFVDGPVLVIPGGGGASSDSRGAVVIHGAGILYTTPLQRTRGGTEAMYLLAQHVFEDLGYRRYEWKCNALNLASREAAHRLGFTFEGIFRQHVIVKGRNRDTTCPLT